ncbi:MAG: beta-galactosidase [Bacteroidales bacterium]|nr:beta-galactosidase [Bacteroidales bacterium]
MLCLCWFNLTSGQDIYTIDVSQTKKEILRDHLDLGGKSVTGESIEVNSFYIERNGKPYFPVMGEFHYSRFPNQYWDEEIKKMKAGGINVIASYVFWILHERQEGVFNWQGDLNLRKFVELCHKNDMEVIIRIGPFAHGEMRNGGLPDWLYGRPFEIRSNDPAYLAYVKRLYDQIANQLKELYFKDGGPIIGIQLENEYQHSAAPWSLYYPGSDKEWSAARFDREIIQGGVGVNEMGNDYAAYGQKHMQLLKEMAKSAGMDVPIYTATGWGFASIVEKGSIPVSGGYAYPTWVASDIPSTLYLYKDLHKNPDYSPVSYNPELYPSMAAELGTGMCNTYTKRPRVPAESFLPMMVRTLGSGTNGLGYYMYHGGNNPSDGPLYYSEGFGYTNKSYDYQAPIGEYGIAGRGFYYLKLVNYFLQHYGDLLAPLPTVLPETNSRIAPDNTTTLRYAVRSNGNTGFLFMHNFQDHVKTGDLNNLQIKIHTGKGEITIPETGSFNLKTGTSVTLPFHLELDGLLIKYATVQPFCSFMNANDTYHVFWSVEGLSPEIVFNNPLSVKTDGIAVLHKNGNMVVTGEEGKLFECIVDQTEQKIHFLVIPMEKALQAYLTGSPGNQHLVISEAIVLEEKDIISLIKAGKEEWKIEVYPKVKSVEAVDAKLTLLKSEKDYMTSWNISVSALVPAVTFTRTDDRHTVLDAKDLNLKNLNDVYIRFDYLGDRAMCFLNGELQTDNFCIGEPWLIGLKRFESQLQENDMYFYFIPMKKKAPYLSYFDKEILPDFSAIRDFLEIKEPEVIPEYKVKIKIMK